MQNKPVQGSKEWHAWRRARVTSTDAIHVMEGNINDWYKLWLYKMGEEPEDFVSPAMQWGNVNEDLARTEYNELTKLFTLPSLAYRELNGVPIGSSLDGQDCLDKTKIVEIKCPYSRDLIGELVAANCDLKAVEIAYWVQCQHHMLVVETDKCDFFAWTPDKHLLITIEADKEYQSRMIDKMESFWEYVRAKSPPINYILTDTWESLEKEYKEAYEQEKFWLKKKLEAQAALVEMADEKPAKGKHLTMYRTKRQGNVDVDKMVKAFGIDKDVFRKPDTWYWRITFNG